MLVIPDVGKRNILAMMASYMTANTCQVKLYKANVTPGPGTLLAALTEADFSGYAAQDLTTPTVEPDLDGNNRGVLAFDEVAFEHNGGGTGNDIYGYFAVDDAGDLLWAERFGDAPRSVTADPDEVRFTPRITNKSQFSNV